MDQHTLQVLEFRKICQLLGQKTLSPIGHQSALAITPMTDREQISLALDQVSELKGLFQEGVDIPLQRFEDIRPSLAMCRHGGVVLEPENLLRLSHILSICQQLVAFAKEHCQNCPHLEELIYQLRPLEMLRKKIDQRIDDKGQIRDDASKKLRALREEKDRIRDRILATLRSLLSSQAGDKGFKEEIITLRDGRYVIPVRGHQRHRIQGVVHDRSASGTTLFVEPTAVLEPGNKLREVELEEKREILRILRNLTHSVIEQGEDIDSNLTVLGGLDLIQAKVRFSLELHAIHPKINDNNVLRLKGGRHPLLMLMAQEIQEVVPLDMDLGDRYHTLVVTGPNTGGKTVVLKTLGLLSLMVQAGLHIPAHSDSEMPIYGKIFADIGDEQSIEQSLSTFSSHLRQIVKILEQADQDTLVLLDEIGVGTDPEEGAALAMAVLDALTQRQVITVATTHYGSLKVYAHDRPGIENASLEFDRQTLRPTYRFHVGVPGSSYALEIANRLGMPPSVVKEATDLIGPGRRETAELIEDLKERVLWYERKKAELQERDKKLHRLVSEYEDRLKGVREEEQHIKEKAYGDAQVILTEAKALVEREIAQIRKGQASKMAIKEAHRALDEQTRRMRNHLASLVPKQTSPASVLKKGDTIWVESLQAEGEVVAVMGQGSRYKVQVGNLVMELKSSDLRPLSRPKDVRTAISQGVDVGQVLTGEIAGEVDLRGLTSEEAVEKLEKFLDQAMLAGLTTLWVIHGKGTGVLRKRVGDFLKQFPGVKAYRLGAWNEGGDGVTVVELE